MNQAGFVPLTEYHELPATLMQQRAAEFLAEMGRRRSVRQFSDRPLPPGVIEDCLRTAGTAPSGANMQPWHFVVVQSAAVKRQIRQAAEQEERAVYSKVASPQWLADLAPLGTSADKPFLETAPCLVVVFAQLSGRTPSRMGFLNEILSRPPEERPLVVLVTGYPAEDAMVPRIEKKSLQQIASFR